MNMSPPQAMPASATQSCSVDESTNGLMAADGPKARSIGLRRYFTWRCIGLHAIVVVIVPGFLLLGRWQLHAAEHGNGLSWAYTVEWPLFAIYAVYLWWQLIHDRRPAEKIRTAVTSSSATSSLPAPTRGRELVETTPRIVDAQVVAVSVHEDQLLRSYNRYLAGLADGDPATRWSAPGSGGWGRSRRRP